MRTDSHRTTLELSTRQRLDFSYDPTIVGTVGGIEEVSRSELASGTTGMIRHDAGMMVSDPELARARSRDRHDRIMQTSAPGRLELNRARVCTMRHDVERRGMIRHEIASHRFPSAAGVEAGQ